MQYSLIPAMTAEYGVLQPPFNPGPAPLPPSDRPGVSCPRGLDTPADMGETPPMAKRRSKTVPASSRIVVQAAPARRRRSASIVAVGRSAVRRVRKASTGTSGGFLNSERTGAMAGGFLLGVLDKQGTALPTVPVLGRAGTLGVGLYFLGKQMKAPIMVHAATAALAIAAYQMGREGKVSGVDGFDTV